jgi:hypothetical protein
MSTENTQPISEQIKELEHLRRQTRRVHLYTTLLLAFVVILGVGAIISSFYGLTVAGPKQNAYLKHLGSQLQSEVVPLAKRLADPSIKRLKPVVEAELKRLDARAPEVTGVALKELSLLGTNLTVRSGAVLQQTVGRALQQRDARLRKLLPGASDQQIAALLDNIHLEAQDQLLKSGEKVFNPHLNSIQSILADMEKIEATEPIAATQEINPWQVAYLFMDVFTQEFKDLAVTGTTKSQESK